MAGEFRHKDVGTSLTQAEFEGVGGHIFNNQDTGDIVYASSSSQLTRLAISGTSTHVLGISGGIPAWAAPAAAAAGSLTGSTLASGVVTTSVTTVGALNSGSITSGFGTINNGSSSITTTGAVSTGGLTITSQNAGTDTDKFLVLDGSNNVDFRTGDELKTDIGVVSLTGSTDNTICTVTGAAAIQGEANFKFDGTNASIGNGGGFIVGHPSKEVISTDGSTDLTPEIQELGTATADGAMLQGVWSTTATIAAAPMLAQLKSGNATIGSHTIVTNGEVIGVFRWQVDDGVDYESSPAQISAEIDGTPGAGDTPGRIILATTNNGEDNPTESVRIAENGAVIIQDVAADLTIGDIPNNIAGNPAGGDGGRGPGTVYSSDYVQDAFHGGVIWRTADSDPTKAKAYMTMQLTGGGSLIWFGVSNSYSTGVTVFPYISVAGAFVNASDANMKQNVVTIPDATATSIISAMNPVTFDWKVSEISSSGFLAQDIQAISGLTHAVESQTIDGAPRLYVDQNQLLPYFVGCMKDLITRITVLEA
jgi:hypothetical protein